MVSASAFDDDTSPLADMAAGATALLAEISSPFVEHEQRERLARLDDDELRDQRTVLIVLRAFNSRTSRHYEARCRHENINDQLARLEAEQKRRRAAAAAATREAARLEREDRAPVAFPVGRVRLGGLDL